jgi:pimeloyl-ACP methyl ester carboxylesterase
LKTSFLQTEDLRLGYRTMGKGEPTLILIHGLASNQHIWDLLAPLLADKYQLYTLDQRGHGSSEKPPTGYDFDTITKDLHLFIQNLEIGNPIIIGHSWGGNVALNYAAQYPNLLNGICFIDGGLIEISKIPGNSLHQALISMAPPNFANYTKQDFLHRIQQRDWGEQDQTSRAANMANIVLSNFDLHPNGHITPKFNRSNHLQVIEAFWKHKPSQLFERIQCPVLNLPARMPNNDPERQALRQEMVNLAEDSLETIKTIWLENSIHDVPIQKPELISEIIMTEIRNGFFS